MMTATTTQIATFKRHARRVYKLWNIVDYQVVGTDVEIKANEIEAKMDVIEELFSEEQLEAVKDWAYSQPQPLYGVCGIC